MKNDSSRTQYVERFQNPGETNTNITLSSYSGKYAVHTAPDGTSYPKEVYIGPTSVLFNISEGGVAFRIEIRNAYNMTWDDNVRSKGSTYYSQVTSTSSSAYPSNGEQGDYWYVKAW